MPNTDFSELRALTDALAIALDAAEPDLDEVLQLVAQRDRHLAALPAPQTPAERDQRIADLHDLAAADADIQARLREQLTRVRGELQLLVGHERSLARIPAASDLLDFHV